MLTKKLNGAILMVLDARRVSSRKEGFIRMENVKYYRLVNNMKQVKRGFNSLHYQLELRNSNDTIIACYPYYKKDARLNLLARVLESLVVTDSNLTDVVDMLNFEFLGIEREEK